MSTNYVVQTSDKKKAVALWLCIPFGLFGIHQFYVGRIGRGILYACTAGLFMIGWLVDIFAILGGNFKDGAGVPLRK